MLMQLFVKKKNNFTSFTYYFDYNKLLSGAVGKCVRMHIDKTVQSCHRTEL